VKIELSTQMQKDAVASIQRYFEENMPESIGDMPAGLLLKFFVDEIGPVIYNKAISDAQTRMAQRVDDLTGELFEDALQYWPRVMAKRSKAK
jgi:uncharacterized protein (DUF2164 family)